MYRAWCRNGLILRFVVIASEIRSRCQEEGEKIYLPLWLCTVPEFVELCKDRSRLPVAGYRGNLPSTLYENSEHDAAFCDWRGEGRMLRTTERTDGISCYIYEGREIIRVSSRWERGEKAERKQSDSPLEDII